MPPAPAAAWLVRHARAEKGAAGGDEARRLTTGGRAEFKAKVRALGARLRPARILTSPYARARETAALLSAACGGVEVEEEPRLASGASTGAQLLALARESGPGVALVGHNPELAEAVMLAGQGDGDAEVPPGAVAGLDRAGRLAWLE